MTSARRVLFLGLIATLALPAAAQAATCTFVGGVVTVTVEGSDGPAAVGRGTGDVIAYGNQGLDKGQCGTATVSNTSSIVLNGGAAGNVLFLMLANGVPNDGTGDLIPITVNAGNGSDLVVLSGGPQDDSFRVADDLAGAGADVEANLNEGLAGDAGEDVQLNLVDSLSISTRGGDDFVSTRPGGGFPEPLPTSSVDLTDVAADDSNAQDGDDTVELHDDSVSVTAAGGDDTISTGANNDSISPGNGNDTVDGGGGPEDFIRYDDAPAGVRLDLSITGPQTVGASGTETVTGVENVIGGAHADTFLGDVGANELYGQGGDDFVDGRGGNDQLEGNNDIDTVSFGGEASPVTVDLALTTVQDVGATSETVRTFENIAGTRFADSLKGTEAPNSIDGAAGPDAIDSRGGSDTVRSRDGGADSVNCGAAADTLLSDRLPPDSASACERVVPLDTIFAGGPAALIRDRTPSFSLASSEPAAAFDCSLDGAPFAPCARSFEAPSLADGTHTLVARSRDGLGVRDVFPQSRSFTVDATAPRMVALKGGRRVRFRISEAARVRVVLQRAKPSRRGRRFARVGATARQVGPGARRIRLRGRLARALKAPGRYRVLVTATDAAGNRSRRLRARFRIQ